MSSKHLPTLRVPKLRFEQFDNVWQEKKLSEIVTYTKGFAFKSSRYKKQGLRVVRVSDIGSIHIKQNNEKIFIDKDDAIELERYHLRKGNIIITTVGSHPNMVESAVGRGIFVDNDDEGMLNQNMLKIEPNDQFNTRFIFAYINDARYVNHIKAIKRGNANQANISVKDLLEYGIFCTTKKEQDKIAGFLTAVDDKIVVLGKKVGLLKEYKRGVMEAVFSQEMRFKVADGKDFPVWHSKTLKDLCDVVTGKTPSTSNPNLWDGDILFVTPTDIDEKHKYQTTTKRTVRNTSGLHILPKGSIHYTCIASIGKMSVSIKPSITNQQINSLIPRGDIENEFVYYHLLWLTPKIKATQATSTLPIINKTEFSKVKIGVPVVQEQQKIASFFTALDEKINLEESKLEQAKQFKKALLQQMFV